MALVIWAFMAIVAVGILNRICKALKLKFSTLFIYAVTWTVAGRYGYLIIRYGGDITTIGGKILAIAIIVLSPVIVIVVFKMLLAVIKWGLGGYVNSSDSNSEVQDQ